MGILKLVNKQPTGRARKVSSFPINLLRKEKAALAVALAGVLAERKLNWPPKGSSSVNGGGKLREASRILPLDDQRRRGEHARGVSVGSLTVAVHVGVVVLNHRELEGV